MLFHDEYVQILSELGLTRMQARVYIALLCLRSATAKKIYKESKVARQEVYRILSELEEINIIERIIAKPTKFRPIPPNEVISTLLQTKNEKNKQLGKQAIKVFRNFEIDCTESLIPSGATQFVLLSTNKTNPIANTANMRQNIENAQKDVMCLSSFPLFMKIKYVDEQIWKKAVKRGVKFKFIIDSRPENEKLEFTLDPELQNTNYFEIRWIPHSAPVCVLLVDEKEAFCRLGLSAESPVLWSANPFFVAMVKDYLETKWKSLE